MDRSATRAPASSQRTRTSGEGLCDAGLGRIWPSNCGTAVEPVGTCGSSLPITRVTESPLCEAGREHGADSAGCIERARTGFLCEPETMVLRVEFGATLPPITVPGLRFRLRPFGPGDIGVVEAASNDEFIPKITTVPTVFTAEAGRAFIDRQNDRMIQGQGWSLAIATADIDEAVGQVGLWISQLSKGRAEIGYWVAPPHRGRGAASDSVSMISEWAFEHLDLDRLSLFIEPSNGASINTALRAGFEREGILRSWERVDGIPRDMWSFVRTRA